MADNQLPSEIDGEKVDKLSKEIAQLFSKYGINFMKNEDLCVDLVDTIGDFLEEKCGVTITGNTSMFH